MSGLLSQRLFQRLEEDVLEHGQQVPGTQENTEGPHHGQTDPRTLGMSGMKEPR
jgi:hypothetical protein